MQSEDEYVSQRLGGGTAADAEATRQTGDSAAMESEAAGAGMGTASDRLMQASDQLLAAARSFQQGVQQQSLMDATNNAGG